MEQRALLKRFDASGFPSFYHLKDGQCREYDGPRTVDSFAEFARQGYTRVNAWPFYKAPNGLVGKSLAAARKVPNLIFSTFDWLHYDQGYSPLSILIMTISMPVAFGLGLICVLDYFHCRAQALHTNTPVARPHAE